MENNFNLKEVGGEAESRESVESRVVLYFRRHGKKEKIREGQSDEEVALTKEGREQAVALGRGLNPHPEVAMAVGSLRKRAQEVAARALFANEPKITPEMTLEEIKEEIAKEVKYGKKITADRRLDFYDGGSVEFKSLVDKVYGEKRTTDFMVHESDDVVIRNKDLLSTSYTRLASQVAELILKYAGIGANFNRVVKNDGDKYRPFNNQIERFLGTHNTVSESFILKVLEKKFGAEKREEFLRDLGRFGFNEAEGFNVEIVNRGQNCEIKISVKIKEKEWNIEIDGNDLAAIVDDRIKLDERIKKSLNE